MQLNLQRSHCSKSSRLGKPCRAGSGALPICNLRDRSHVRRAEPHTTFGATLPLACAHVRSVESARSTRLTENRPSTPRQSIGLAKVTGSSRYQAKSCLWRLPSWRCSAANARHDPGVNCSTFTNLTVPMSAPRMVFSIGKRSRPTSSTVFAAWIRRHPRCSVLHCLTSTVFRPATIKDAQGWRTDNAMSVTCHSRLRPARNSAQYALIIANTRSYQTRGGKPSMVDELSITSGNSLRSSCQDWHLSTRVTNSARAYLNRLSRSDCHARLRPKQPTSQSKWFRGIEMPAATKDALRTKQGRQVPQWLRLYRRPRPDHC